MAEYMYFAFALPDGIATFRAQTHQETRVDQAKEFARDMLRQVAANGFGPCAAIADTSIGAGCQLR